MIDRILTRWTETTPELRDTGRAWYPNARSFSHTVAKDSGHSAYAIAGVIAALSPRKEWEENKRIAIEAVNQFHLTGTISRLQVRNQTRKAQAILAGLPPLVALKGIKCRAFYHNIAYPNSEAVTVDRHIWRTAHDIPYPINVSQNKRNRLIAEVIDTYQRAAAKLGIKPSVLQATLWLAERDRTP